MGVTVTASTTPGGVTPICDNCGIALCWDLAESEYNADKEFWDSWRCRDCNPDYRGALGRSRALSADNRSLPGADLLSTHPPPQERQAMKTVSIYIDGACSGNPGPGGWGAILAYNGQRKEISGFEGDTTNNRMELTAAIVSLLMIKEPCVVHIHTDSKYVQEGITRYIHNWKVNGWRNSSGKPVRNQDLWETLSEASRMHEITWHWVQGHKGHAQNERADYLAKTAIRKASPS
jgi:ribonuclease HI